MSALRICRISWIYINLLISKTMEPLADKDRTFCSAGELMEHSRNQSYHSLSFLNLLYHFFFCSFSLLSSRAHSLTLCVYLLISYRPSLVIILSLSYHFLCFTFLPFLPSFPFWNENLCCRKPTKNFTKLFKIMLQDGDKIAQRFWRRQWPSLVNVVISTKTTHLSLLLNYQHNDCILQSFTSTVFNLS